MWGHSDGQKDQVQVSRNDYCWYPIFIIFMSFSVMVVSSQNTRLNASVLNALILLSHLPSQIASNHSSRVFAISWDALNSEGIFLFLYLQCWAPSIFLDYGCPQAGFQFLLRHNRMFKVHSKKWNLMAVRQPKYFLQLLTSSAL